MLLITVLTIFFFQYAFALGPAQITKRTASTSLKATSTIAKCNSDNCLVSAFSVCIKQVLTNHSATSLILRLLPLNFVVHMLDRQSPQL